jgi:hypothetical protein
MPERSLLLLALYGVLLGARHALEPDHLAAVSTMAAHGRSRPAVLRVAAAWGAGHATLVAGLGLLLTLLRLEMPDWLAGRLDQVVGVVMIVLGAQTIWRARRERLHVHVHTHEAGATHAHFHVHRQGADHVHPAEPHWMRRPATAYAVGSLHGLAGSGAAAAAAALIAPGTNAAVLYLLCFAAGSMAGMLAVGALGLWPIFWAASSTAAARRFVQGLAGAASVIVGFLLANGTF